LPLEEFIIGVDVGGTKVAAGIVDCSGVIRHEARVPMVASEGAGGGIASVVAAIELVLAKLRSDSEAVHSVRGIGICSPGPLDPANGIVINPPNLPCWRNFPLASEISKAYKIPVKLDNDGNAAALAEALWGAGRNYRNVFYATIGTGIGTGIVFDKRIYHGRTGAAAEGGHVSIDYRGPRCQCGKLGCIEALASGPAIAARARAKLHPVAGYDSILLGLAGGNVTALTCEMVSQAYAAGDCVARQVLEETVALLTLWLGNIVDLLEPDVIVIGGGVAAMLIPFLDEIRKQLPACSVNSHCQDIPLVMAQYGASAGVAGAAALSFSELVQR